MKSNLDFRQFLFALRMKYVPYMLHEYTSLN